MSDSLPTYFTLNNGIKFPTVGMGCWMGEPGGGQRVYDMCTNALKVGYRHFDTADGYKNEEEVGRAIKDSGIPREEIFITTKLNNSNHHQVQEAFDKSLAALNSDYIDLYLVHWPQASVDSVVLQPEDTPTIIDTWKDMEKLLQTGKCKAIGVSNFGVSLLKRIVEECSIVPATNQVELHPCLPVEDLRAYCKSQGIIITAYSPIGQPREGKKLPTFLEDEPVKGIAARLSVAPAQVVLSWAVQHGIVVVPKSENPERMKQNLALVKLSEEDMQAIDAIHRQPGQHRSLLGYHSENGVFGWTYEQLGWNMTKGAIVPS